MSPRDGQLCLRRLLRRVESSLCCQGSNALQGPVRSLKQSSVQHCAWSLIYCVLLQTFMQPAGGMAPSMAPHEGVTSSDGRGIEGAGIGLDTGDLITKDQSPTSQTNPYLVAGRKGMGSPAPLAVTPGGV